MPGAVDLNPDKVKPLSDIARKVGERANGSPIYVAGPDAVKAGKADHIGQIVSNSYARQARGIRQNANQVKSLMREHNTTEYVAREYSKDLEAAWDQFQAGEITENEWSDIKEKITGSP